jgi:tetratricopeptide (TPR) repeat protein
MDLFDWWKRRDRRTAEADSVRDALISAVRRSDLDELVRLCNQHAALIFNSFKTWQRVPPGIRDNQDARNTYGQMLIRIGQLFESAGHPELLASLMPEDADNPIVRWRSGSLEARQLSEAGRYQESNALLHQILEEMKGAWGSAIDEYRPKIYGWLGTNYFRLDNLGQSGRYFELALRDCERTGDRKGVVIYSENLQSLLAANPESVFTEVRKDIAKAQDLSDSLRYEDSNSILQKVLDNMNRDTAAQAYRPKVHGLLGSNYFRLGDLQRAREQTEQALEECERVGDDDGIRIYKENLRVISAPAPDR